MILVCFDVDGTLDSSGGPVSFAWVKACVQRLDFLAMVVSPSVAWPQGELPASLTGGSRADNLRAAAVACEPTATLRLYVSDNKDQAEAQAAGFVYIEAADFARGVISIGGE